MLPRTKRHAAVVLEAIIALPIAIIALFAIVQFGLLSSNQSLVHSASRSGADIGSSLDLPTSGDVPTEIINAVSKTLAARGMTYSCIRVEHSNGPAPPYVLETGIGGEAPAAAPPTEDYICVSVCVENTELAPNLLEAFCLDLEGTFSQQTVCRCYTPPPTDDVLFDILVEGEGPEVTASVGTSVGNGWLLYSNGTTCFDVTVPADGTYTFSSRLWGDQGGPDLPNAAFVVGGVQVANNNVSELSHATAGVYSTDVFLTAGTHQLCIAFTNDFFVRPIDRNLFVDWMALSGPN